MLSGRPDDDASIQRTAVSRDRFTVGRHNDNSLSIYNETVSGQHAELLRISGDLFVRDLDSTNGTLHNGRRITGLTGLQDGDILHFGSAMYTLQAAVQEVSSSTVMADAQGDAVAQVQFSRLLTEPAVEPFLQPIVRLDSERHVGYEILARSRLIGLETPARMFRVAGQRAAENALSQVCRVEGLQAASMLGTSMQYYVNTHPREIASPELITSLEQLRSRFPDLPIVLEVHESAVASMDYLRQLKSELAILNIKLAYDDFGAGQARLMELFEVPPDILKFDIGFVQGLRGASRQRLATTRCLIEMVNDLGVTTLAEGVESREEAHQCRECGFELAQGYLFGEARPARYWKTHS